MLLKINSYEIYTCTGEQVAGFKENGTGKFHEIMLIRNAADLDESKAVEKIVEKVVEVEKTAAPGSNVVILFTNDMDKGVSPLSAADPRTV